LNRGGKYPYPFGLTAGVSRETKSLQLQLSGAFKKSVFWREIE
jgi:hypothetical protein